MNKVVLMGRLTKNPEIKYAGKDNDMAVARYTLAVNRRYKRDGEQEADFIFCLPPVYILLLPYHYLFRHI